MTHKIHFTSRSSNAKTGPIPVSTFPSAWCPDACPLKEHGCYAKYGPIGWHWKRVNSGAIGGSWRDYLKAVAELPTGKLHRIAQAGDFPGNGRTLSRARMRELVLANTGKTAIGYTHYDPIKSRANREIIADAVRNGLTINLSGNSLEHADKLADLGIAPVVTMLPSESTGAVTPAGRRVVVCPAITNVNTTCQSCKLCSRANRKVIVGFPAHGTEKRIASKIALGGALSQGNV